MVVCDGAVGLHLDLAAPDLEGDVRRFRRRLDVLLENVLRALPV